MSSTDALNSPSKRGPYKKSYTKDDIFDALTTYRNAQRLGTPMTFTRAGSPYNIPDSTLRYYHRKTSLAIAMSPRHAVPTEVMAAAVTASSAATHRRLLNDDFEQKLMQYITTCRELAQPLDIHMIRHKAQRLHYAANNIALTAENRDILASEHWWNGFKKRHPDHGMRTPQQLAIARARATQPEIINHFYDLLEYELKTHAFEPHQIWAADETGVDNNFKPRKVFVPIGMYVGTTKKSECMHVLFWLYETHVDFLYFFLR